MLEAVRAFRLAPGVRLRQSGSGDELLVPEGIVSLSETAAAIVALVDGRRDEAAIVESLAERFDAPVADLAHDVNDMLGKLLELGFLRA